MTGEFTLIFDLDNEAFQDGKMKSEIARILKEISEKVESGFKACYARDINDNTVGQWDIYTED